MITPIKTMTISQIIARQDELLVSADDVKAIAKNERNKLIDCLPKCHDGKYKCLLSKDDCFECMNQALDKIEKQIKEQN